MKSENIAESFAGICRVKFRFNSYTNLPSLEDENKSKIVSKLRFEAFEGLEGLDSQEGKWARVSLREEVEVSRPVIH